MAICKWDQLEVAATNTFGSSTTLVISSFHLGWAWYHHHFHYHPHYHPPLGRRSMAQARRHRLDGTGLMAQARRHRLEAWVHISDRTTQLKSSINIGVSASTEWQDIYPFCSKRVTHQLNLPQPTRSMSCLKCLCKLNARSKHRRG